jgi:Mn-containing catalase
MSWEYVEDPVSGWLSAGKGRNHGAENNPQGEPAVDGTEPFTHEQHVPG